MKRAISKILLFTLMLAIGVFPFLPAGAESEVLATVLFTNDTRGFTEDLTYIQRYKENTPNAFLLNCGNFSKGSAEASYSNAKYSATLMKEAGYDLISLGTDDFAYGFRATKRFADYTGCRMLSGNVNYSSASLFEKNVIVQIGSLKIGFFSLADAKAADYIPTARADGYNFSEEYAFAAEQVEELKTKCDKIICLASFFENNTYFTPEKLASQVEGIDVLICSNLRKEINSMQNTTLILSAPEQLEGIGVIQFESANTNAQVLPRAIYDDKGNEMQEMSGTYRCFGQSLVYNDARQKLLEDFEKNITDPIALNKTTIYGVHESTDISLLEETPLGDLFADAMTLAADKLKASDARYEKYRVAAVVSGTNIMANISSGKITLRDVFNARTIADDVYFYEADAALLYDLMEKSVSEISFNEKTNFVENPSPLFLQISGFCVLVNPKKEAGSRIERMYVIDGDDEIDIEKTDSTKFLLAINEPLAKGLCGYDAFLDKKPNYVGDFLVNYIRTAIASAVSEEYYISPGTESRITFKRIEELQPNGDAWATIGKHYEEHAACEVLVDGIDNFDCSQVDENGKVRITLKTGAHGVSVNGSDIYCSTESGLGIEKNTITPIVDYKLYYKTLDEAYKIDESAYEKEAVDGYFEYLSRAYVQTKLTEEGEVVKATQDIFNVWDDFLENPSSFIKNEYDDEADDETEAAPYPKLEDFAYKGNFQSTVFSNTPHTSDSGKSYFADVSSAKSNGATSSRTGDIVMIILLVVFAASFVAATCIVIYYLKTKNSRGIEYEHESTE